MTYDPTDYVDGIPGYDPVDTAGAGDWFDVDAARRAIDFFCLYIRHVKGPLAGEPYTLEDWERSIIANAFGWKRADGSRRYREVFEYEPRKNSKTTRAAGIALYCFRFDGEEGAEVYNAAADREQAGLCFGQAQQMVLQDSDLAELCNVQRKVIESGASVYKAISADANTKHGYNASAVIFDELHAQPNRELYDVLLTSMAARRQPLMWTITTADYMRESICNEKYDYACKIRDGVISDRAFLPVIYEAPQDADWRSPDTWAIANPNLGKSVGLEYIERACQKAQDNPAEENTFRRLHLNQRTESAVRWFGLHKWDDCTKEVRAFEGAIAYGGLDVAAREDICAFVLVFPHEEDDSVSVLPTCWVPEKMAQERERKTGVPYTQWIRDGHLKATPGERIDQEIVKADIEALIQRYDVRGIGFDQWNAEWLHQQLCERVTLHSCPQTISALNEASKKFESLIATQQIRHDTHPVLRWTAGNVTVETDKNGNIKPSKKASAEKIDPIVAAVMAIREWLYAERQEESAYESRGLLVL